MKQKQLFLAFAFLAGTAFYSCDNNSNEPADNTDNPGKTDTITTAANTDADGNVYHTVTIGTQTWMLENLRTTKYNDGTPIPNVTDQAAWKAQTSAAYCWLDNDAANKTKYGALYNYYAVTSGKLAPKGWHVATYDEWNTLMEYGFAHLGNSGSIAKALADSTGWMTLDAQGYPGYNMATNNSLGFKGVPAGGRRDTGFMPAGASGNWWSAPGMSTGYAFRINYYEAGLGVGGAAQYCGFSVRCVKDN